MEDRAQQASHKEDPFLNRRKLIKLNNKVSIKIKVNLEHQVVTSQTKTLKVNK